MYNYYEVATEPSRRFRYFEATEPSIVLTVLQFWVYGTVLTVPMVICVLVGWNIIESVHVHAVVYSTVKILSYLITPLKPLFCSGGPA